MPNANNTTDTVSACDVSTQTTNDQTRPEIAFISGPIDTGADSSYFHEHYAPRINAAISRGDSFVIGPVTAGVDADALSYLLSYPISPDRITIFVTPAEDVACGKQFRALGVRVEVVEGQTAGERDAAMTRSSTYDILRWRGPDEAREFYGASWREGYVTNTERNWQRRKGLLVDGLAPR